MIVMYDLDTRGSMEKKKFGYYRQSKGVAQQPELIREFEAEKMDQAWPTWNLAKPVTLTPLPARTCLIAVFGSFTNACSVSTTSLK